MAWHPSDRLFKAAVDTAIGGQDASDDSSDQSGDAFLGTGAESTGSGAQDAAMGLNQPSTCSYCGGTDFTNLTDNGRAAQATCATCGGTMSSVGGGQWTPELIGDPSNHPKPYADPASGGVGGAAAASDNLIRDPSRRGSLQVVRIAKLADPELQHVMESFGHNPASGEQHYNRQFTVSPVKRAGFSGYVEGYPGHHDEMKEMDREYGESREDGFDEDLYDRVTPDLTSHEHRHYEEHGEYPESYYDRHDQAYQEAKEKRDADESPVAHHEALNHFLSDKGNPTQGLWRDKGEVRDVPLHPAPYATQPSIVDRHINRYLQNPHDTVDHVQSHGLTERAKAYPGTHMPMFVKHEGNYFTVEGHHRTGAALLNHEPHVRGFVYDADKHGFPANHDGDSAPEGGLYKYAMMLMGGADCDLNITDPHEAIAHAIRHHDDGVCTLTESLRGKRNPRTAATDGPDWCTYRNASHCWYPSSPLAEPQDRGVCPWDTTWQQAICPISDPGPQAVMRAKGALRELAKVAQDDPDFGFHVTAAWADVRAKAVRIRREGGVRITVASNDGVAGEVKGDHNVYESALTFIPGSRKIGTWNCGCRWAAFAWGRSAPYKRFEGRMCSHALAMQFEAQARGMFGKEVHPDQTRPDWLKPHSPVVIQNDRDTNKNQTRRAVPPGNMRSEWTPKSRVRVKSAYEPQGATDWRQFDTNRHYRNGRQDGFAGDFHDSEHLHAKNEMGVGLEPHEIDYLTGHAHGLADARAKASEPSAEQLFREHGMDPETHEMELKFRESSLRPVTALVKAELDADEDPPALIKILQLYGLTHAGAKQILDEALGREASWSDEEQRCPHCHGYLGPAAFKAGRCPHCGHAIAHKEAAGHFSDDDPHKVYLRFGHWPDDERSHNNVTGFKEDGVSVYELDHHGHPMDPDPNFGRGHEHDEHCEPDCDLHLDNDDFGNDTREEMEGRVRRAERNRYNGVHRAGEEPHLVKGDMVAIGHDGEPLLNNVKRVGDWIDHRHLFVPGAEPHRLARHPEDEDYEPPNHRHAGVVQDIDEDAEERKKKHKHDTNDTRRHAPEYGYGVPNWGLPLMWCDQCEGSGCGHCGGTGQVVDTSSTASPHQTSDPIPDQNGDEGSMMSGGISSTGAIPGVEYREGRTWKGNPNVTAHLPDGERIGELGWHPQKKHVTWVAVYDDEHRRKGVASGMLAKAREIDPEVHHNDLNDPEAFTDAGRAWAEKVGKKADAPTVSGVALKAADTGRVLMIQRSNGDKKDPAAGTWEFPGGHHEEGDTTSLHAGIREWQEETGHPFPDSGVVHHTWTSPNGVYQGHVVVVPSERDAVDFSNGRSTVNPDDPDGDDHEQSAWWEIEHARKNPALRAELKTGTPWKEIAKAGDSKTASAWDSLDSLNPPPGRGVEEPEHSNSQNPASSGFLTAEDPQSWQEIGDRPSTLAPANSIDAARHLPMTDAETMPWGYDDLTEFREDHPDLSPTATLHDEPEGALPTTDGADSLEEAGEHPSSVASTYEVPETNSAIDPTDTSATPDDTRTASVADIVAKFQATAGAKALQSNGSAKPKGDDMSFDIAAAARAHLAGKGGAESGGNLQHTALKDFSYPEQQELINEGARDGARARNFGDLKIEGTHYEALQKALAQQGDGVDDEDLLI